MRPRSLAILGANQRPYSFAWNLARSIRTTGYSGRLFLINPKYRELEGEPCYPDVASLPERPDCVLFAVRDSSVPGALERVADAGIRAGVIFGRLHGDVVSGPKLTERVSDIARAADMAVCGGNCMGFVNLLDRLQVSGLPFEKLGPAGQVSLISHSGSSWAGLVGSPRALGLNIAISAGQELVTSTADYIKFLINSVRSRAIACILEVARDPTSFIEALDLADERGVPIVVLKLGRSEAGQRYAFSHSGALTSTCDVYDAVFRKYNVVSVQSIDELVDTVEMLSMNRIPTTSEIALGTDSGGERQLIADLASGIGVHFARLNDSTLSRLRDLLDPGMEPDNPLDYWGDGNDVMAACLQAMAADDCVGTVVMASNMPPGRPFLKACATAISDTYNSTTKPVALMGNIATAMCQDEAAQLRRRGIPVLMGTETGLRAIRHFGAYHENRRTALNISMRQLDREATERCRRTVHRTISGMLPCSEAFLVLEEFGIACAPWVIVDTSTDIEAFVAAHGFPIVAKIDSSDIPHKTDLGLVVTGLKDIAAAIHGVESLKRRRLGRVLVQKQLQGIEFFLGMTTDKSFGPVVVLGFGGVYIELLRDSVTLLPPIDPETAFNALSGLRGFPILKGPRGLPACDPRALAMAISRFGDFVITVSGLLSEVDLNPVFLSGSDVTVVDALLVRDAIS